MKKLILAFCLCLLTAAGFAYEKSDLYGSWVLSTEMENVAAEPQKIVPVVGIKSFLQATLTIVPEGENTFVRFAGYGPINIISSMKGTEGVYYLRTKYQTKKDKEPLITILTFKFLDDDTITMHVGDPNNFYPQFPTEEDVILYRFFTPKTSSAYTSKTIAAAKLFRKPATDCEDWGIISSGKNVLVKEIKGDFVKVEIDGYPDGWMVSHALEKK